MTRVIEGHPNYLITDSGDVYRKDGDFVSRLHPNMSNGHARVTLDGVNEYVAKLVMDQFNPSPSPTYKVFHIDGDQLNNDISNLVWLSPSDIQLYSGYTIEYRKQFLGARD